MKHQAGGNPAPRKVLHAMKKTTQKKSARKATPNVRRKQPTKPRTTPAPKQPSAQAEDTTSKKDIVIALLRREEGATLNELMTATAWQKHSVRGFISGTLRKKLGLIIQSTKRDHDHVYKIDA